MRWAKPDHRVAVLQTSLQSAPFLLLHRGASSHFGRLHAPTVSHPEMQPIYTLHLVCLSMKVNTLGVVLVVVFGHNSK